MNQLEELFSGELNVPGILQLVKTQYQEFQASMNGLIGQFASEDKLQNVGAFLNQFSAVFVLQEGAIRQILLNSIKSPQLSLANVQLLLAVTRQAQLFGVKPSKYIQGILNNSLQYCQLVRKISQIADVTNHLLVELFSSLDINAELPQQLQVADAQYYSQTVLQAFRIQNEKQAPEHLAFSNNFKALAAALDNREQLQNNIFAFWKLAQVLFILTDPQVVQASKSVPDKMKEILGNQNLQTIHKLIVIDSFINYCNIPQGCQYVIIYLQQNILLKPNTRLECIISSRIQQKLYSWMLQQNEKIIKLTVPPNQYCLSIDKILSQTTNLKTSNQITLDDMLYLISQLEEQLLISTMKPQKLQLDQQFYQIYDLMRDISNYPTRFLSILQAYFMNLMYVLCFVTRTKVRLNNNWLGYQAVGQYIINYECSLITYYNLVLSQLNDYQEFSQTFAVFVFKNCARQGGLSVIFPIVEQSGQIQIAELESKMLDYQKLKGDYNGLVQQYNGLKQQLGTGAMIPNQMQQMPYVVQQTDQNQQQVNELTKENGQLKLRIVELESKNDNLQQLYAQVTEEKVSVSKQLDSVSQMNSVLQQQLKQQQDQTTKAREELSSLALEKQHLDKEKMEFVRSINELGESSRSFKACIENVQKIVDAALKK